MNIGNTMAKQATAAKSNNTKPTNERLVGNFDPPPAQQKAPNDALGKDAFLKILVTQLQHQDPLNPMQDKDFIAQMATFNSLEQMINMNKMLETLVISQNGSQLLQFSEMIGKKVSFETVTDKKDEQGNFITEKGEGIVKSVHYKGTEVIIELMDGKKINAFTITSVGADIKEEEAEVEEETPKKE
ncbi:flagellar hook assembly protein FlgD [Priestia taiwanensis]|uniref:Basal-body rod modification protein FlgD n=1 Tax=Priestia taiwanensis TaxID=1347902 RepID=A0A917AQK3_9BACI|nr:flagellar hook assembly protein FlgD [Priestia taiwanensis]MBM7362837.1 flagellar basal-body rod modification protein FlgD [Priestia taiwanensis]GGE65516.1 hypothetical protein GCM10007140_14610 [Priestia taiwanensis]